MKKLILPCLMAALLSTTAFASVDRTQVYDNQFSDLEQSSTFYDNVAALYEYGLSVGKADGTYDLDGSLTLGEAVVFSARVRSLLTTNTAEDAITPYREDGQDAYAPYYAYLQAEVGLEDDFPLYSLATRAQMAHILVQAMPEDTFEAINQDLVTQGYALGKYITDVDEYTPYYSDILTLYKWGISGGYDAKGSYQPDATITRGATAAFVTRLVDEDLRITLDWSLSSTTNSAQGTTLASLIEPGEYIAAPITDEEIDQAVRYMLSQDTNVLTLQYDSLDKPTATQYHEAILSTVKTYCEQNYNSVSTAYHENGYMQLTFGCTSLDEKTSLEPYRQAFMDAAIEVHDALWSAGTLDDTMSQSEIAWVYYQWICENVSYDLSASAGSMSHLPYNALVAGVAVCDGYTGAYNVFLKLEGIQCYGLPNASHIWTVATLDGIECHIDTTWGDAGLVANPQYFAMTPEQSYAIHSW